MEERPVYFKRILFSFLLATVIFVSAFLIGYAVSYSRYQSFAISQDEMKYSLYSVNVERELIGSSCSLFDLTSLSKELDQSGSIIGLLETRLGKEDEQVLKQKRIYSLLEVQHMLLVNEFKEKCKGKLDVILFFYSNEGEDFQDSEKLGYMLTYLKKNQNNLMIYSFDYNLDSPILELLKKKYSITHKNMVVINENKTLSDIQNVDEILMELE